MGCRIEKLVPDKDSFVSNDEFIRHLRLATGLAGSAFVQYYNVDLTNAVVAYYLSFDQYKADHPDTEIRPDRFTYWFNGQQQRQRMLMREPVKIMKNLPMLTSMQIYVPDDDRYMTVKLTRRQAEKYFGIDMDKLGISEMHWRRFVERNILTEDGPSRFCQKFAVEAGPEKPWINEEYKCK